MMAGHDEDEARAFVIARELIAKHGNGVAQFLEDKINGLMEAHEFEELSDWCIIRNAVALTLTGGSTLQ